MAQEREKREEKSGTFTQTEAKLLWGSGGFPIGLNLKLDKLLEIKELTGNARPHNDALWGPPERQDRPRRPSRMQGSPATH